MSARESILGRVRAGLAAHPRDDLRRARVEERIRSHPSGTVPARALGDPRALQALFVAMARAADATVETVAISGEVPGEIAAFLREHQLGLKLRMGAEPFLARLPWETAPDLAVSRGPAGGDTAVGLSLAAAAAAETGTLVLASGAANPTTLNFLPETHIVVLLASRVVGSYEDAWSRLRRAPGEGPWPRAVNFITGPSRTADIEQTLLMGAHGPRRLHVIVVERA